VPTLAQAAPAGERAASSSKASRLLARLLPSNPISGDPPACLGCPSKMNQANALPKVALPPGPTVEALQLKGTQRQRASKDATYLPAPSFPVSDVLVAKVQRGRCGHRIDTGHGQCSVGPVGHTVTTEPARGTALTTARCDGHGTRLPERPMQ
jgi:hypothetical protein